MQGLAYGIEQSAVVFVLNIFNKFDYDFRVGLAIEFASVLLKGLLEYTVVFYCSVLYNSYAAIGA